MPLGALLRRCANCKEEQEGKEEAEEEKEEEEPEGDRLSSFVAATPRRLEVVSLSGLAKFVFIFSSLTILLTIGPYAWQKKRGFAEYDRFMGWLKSVSPCAHTVVSVPLRIVGAICNTCLRILNSCWQPCFKRLDENGKKTCPSAWGRVKRCMQHCCGACYYISERSVIAVDEVVASDAAVRIGQGMAPKRLKEEAQVAATNWDPSKLGEAVTTLENASRHVDGYRPPFQLLRRLVTQEVGRQIHEQLDSKGDYAAESAYFTSKTDKPNLGKDTSPEDFDRRNFFMGAGPMERVSTIIDELERSGGTLSDKDCKPFRPVIDSAASDRLQWAIAQEDYRAIQYAFFCVSALRAMNLPEVKQASDRYKKLRELPDDWDVVQMVTNYGYRMLAKKKVAGSLMGICALPGSLFADLQKLLDDTFFSKYTRDRKGGEVPQRLVLVRATIIQNEQNWSEYIEKRRKIASQLAIDELRDNERYPPKTLSSNGIKQLPKLDDTVQEAWLFHGTTAEGAEAITSDDFRLNLAGTAAGTLYGRGVYLAEACSKSDEYTEDEGGERYLLLCRATLGRIKYNDEARPDTTKLEDSCLKGNYHSVLGDREKTRGTYREFMVYDDDQVYPAYIVRYRRQYYS